MTPRIGRDLDGFHHRVARRLMGRQSRRVRDGVWFYPLSVGINGGGRILGGRDLCLLPPEHIITVNCNQAHYGPVPGGGAEAGVKVDQAVVGAGRIGCGGDANSGS